MSKSIQEELIFEASPQSVYEALTSSEAFTAVSGGAPAEISTEVGGEFSCFGGQIVGVQVELVPNELIVQDWRAASWGEGTTSRVRFEMKAEGSGTRLIFEHSGFPEGEEEHLAGGWHKMYWEPLKQHLA